MLRKLFGRSTGNSGDASAYEPVLADNGRVLLRCNDDSVSESEYVWVGATKFETLSSDDVDELLGR